LDILHAHDRQAQRVRVVSGALCTCVRFVAVNTSLARSHFRNRRLQWTMRACTRCSSMRRLAGSVPNTSRLHCLLLTCYRRVARLLEQEERGEEHREHLSK
jgi:hypothetical protein